LRTPGGANNFDSDFVRQVSGDDFGLAKKLPAWDLALVRAESDRICSARASSSSPSRLFPWQIEAPRREWQLGNELSWGMKVLSVPVS